jgi:prophage tail gpP-like protein
VPADYRPAVVVLRVNGVSYSGWESARITRGIESIAGGFELLITDRLNSASVRWPIIEESLCELLIDNQKIISGYVDKRSISLGATAHSLSVSGRDRAAALVDSSAYVGKWEFTGVSILTLTQLVSKNYGVKVSLQPGLTLSAPLVKVTIDPGESAFEVVERSCRMAGLLPVSDGLGGIVLTRAGSRRCGTALLEGQNVLEASVDFEASGRFARYVVLGQHPGDDEYNGLPAATVRGEAKDAVVKRQERLLVVRADGNVTPEHAIRRAQWEAKVRAGKAEAASVTVQGWTDGSGEVWPVNALVYVRLPTLGIDGDMLISQAQHQIGSSGTTTQLNLKRPDAFIPEPVVTQKGERWLELDKPGKKATGTGGAF